MIGAVKHVEKALEAGVDIICAQGGEGGGHTGLSASTSPRQPYVKMRLKRRLQDCLTSMHKIYIRMYTQSKNVTIKLIHTP